MITISSNYTPKYCVEYVSHLTTEGNLRFKIYSESESSTNYKLTVELLTKNLEYKRIAFNGSCVKDIEGIIEISPYDTEEKRINDAKKNIETAKKWIKKFSN